MVYVMIPFNPILIPKRKTMVDCLENVIVSLYAKGMRVSDIEEQVREVYNLDVYQSTILQITDAIKLISSLGKTVH